MTCCTLGMSNPLAATSDANNKLLGLAKNKDLNKGNKLILTMIIIVINNTQHSNLTPSLKVN